MKWALLPWCPLSDANITAVILNCSITSHHMHVLQQVPSAAGKKKGKKKDADRKYGGLEARPDKGRRVLSNRYISEPRKENAGSGYAIMSAASDPRDSAANADELQSPPVAEDEYLLPQSGAAASYMDVVSDNVRGTSSFIVHLLYNYISGAVAPRVECGTCDQQVVGSNPTQGKAA